MDSQRITRDKWKRYITNFQPSEQDKKVKSVTFNLKASDFTGDFNITDLQLQSGNQVTVQMPHTSEILVEKIYNFDEATNMDPTLANTGKQVIKLGDAQPQYYHNLKNRVFNIVGRGHEVVALPNVFHEDYKQDLLTSGLELELYAKEDFDLMRVSTNEGALVPGRMYNYDQQDGVTYDYPDITNTHPLNYIYSREWYFTGSKAGDKITLSCELNSGSVGSQHYPNGAPYGTGKNRQRLPMAPYGSFRLRVEFYKYVVGNVGETDSNGNAKVTRYLDDVGIGWYGTAQFKQVQQNQNHTF